MSKIDEYNRCKNESERMRCFADEVNKMGSGRFITDKFGAKVKLTETYRGRYGDSSTYGWDDNIILEMQKQIELNLRSLATKAAERLEQVTEKARLEAKDEALEILSQTELVGKKE